MRVPKQDIIDSLTEQESELQSQVKNLEKELRETRKGLRAFGAVPTKNENGYNHEELTEIAKDLVSHHELPIEDIKNKIVERSKKEGRSTQYVGIRLKTVFKKAEFFMTPDGKVGLADRQTLKV